MKLEVFKTNLGTVFDPAKDFTSDKNIILIRHPEEPTEGATKGYVERKFEEFLDNPDIKGTIDDINMLKVKGKELIHTQETLELTNTLVEDATGVLLEVDAHGRVVGVHQATEENLDDSSTISWNKVTNTPTTLEGYGINDLIPSDKNTWTTGQVDVHYQDPKTKSPVPYSHLTNKFYSSGYELKPGAIVIKLKTPDSTIWKQANGGIIYRADYPDAVTALAGAGASQATLPDATYHDKILLETYGVEAKTYVKVK